MTAHRARLTAHSFNPWPLGVTDLLILLTALLEEMITKKVPLDIVKQILLASTLGNVKRTVWRICILMLRYILRVKGGIWSFRLDRKWVSSRGNLPVWDWAPHAEGPQCVTGEPYDGITLKDPVEERKINRNEPPSTNMKTRTRKTTSSTPDRGSMVSYPC